MPSRATDWLNQAARDVEFAQQAQHLGHHEWACFAAHQGAEKAVKALHMHCGQMAWGHAVAKLLGELSGILSLPDTLVERARVLDNFYIPTRYPNSHPEGAPFEHYGPLQSQEALDHACQILEFVRAQMARPTQRP